MKIIKPSKILREISGSTNIVMPGGCANASEFYEEFSNCVDMFSNLELISGLSLGSYPYLKKGLNKNFNYSTWQAGMGLRSHYSKNGGRVNLIPLRLGDLTQVVGKNCIIQPDVVVVQASLPQADGTVNLGLSVGPGPHLIEHANTVIAELNHNMPITFGDSVIDANMIDFAYESDQELLTYDTGTGEERDTKIVENVLNLIPEGATIQVGIGGIPDRITKGLSLIKNARIFTGIISDGLLDFIENTDGKSRVLTGEIAGSYELYNAINKNTAIELARIEKTHNVVALSKIDKFVSINSTIEIDLSGQANGEVINGLQVSGVGGSLDYIEAASWSKGGLSIMALPSTTKDNKRSKIVPNLVDGVVTSPRFSVDYVVTEFGVARLRGASLEKRAELLVNIAHPDFKKELESSFFRK